MAVIVKLQGVLHMVASIEAVHILIHKNNKCIKLIKIVYADTVSL